MNYNIEYFLCELAVPTIVLVVTTIWRKNPPKPNWWWGYGSSRSMSSVEAWNTAQELFGKYCARVFIPIIAVSLIAGISAVYMRFEKNTSFTLCMILCAVNVIAAIVISIVTECKLRALFDEHGNYKSQ